MNRVLSADKKLIRKVDDSGTVGKEVSSLNRGRYVKGGLSIKTNSKDKLFKLSITGSAPSKNSKLLSPRKSPQNCKYEEDTT